MTKGQKPEIGHRTIEVSGYGDCQISTQCTNKELAVKWLDYGYSEAGQLLFNYGVEGESYAKDADGNIQYTDLLLNNQDGKGFQEMLQYYASPGSWGPFLRSGNYMKVAAQRPQQQESLRVWMDTNMKEHVMPKMQFGEDVASKLSTLETEISTYADEMGFKFIMGVEPIENFDKYLAQLKSLGVDEYVQEYRKAYDHFKER